jgi:hypothetical protein
MNDLTRRIEILETQTRRDSLGPRLEALAAQTGFSVTELQDEVERLHVTYGTNPLAVERGVAEETGLTVEQVRDEAESL